MKVTQIEFKKLVNLGNFEHESLSVVVVLDEYESPHSAVDRARKFIDAELSKNKDDIPF